MIGNYSVVSKGNYIHKQTSEALHVERFLIVRKRKRRILLLEVNNLTERKLTALKIQIEQFDAKGNALGSVQKEWKKISIPFGQTLLKKPIGVQPSCVDIRIKILYAECGDYTYRLGKDDTYVTFEKKKDIKKLSDAEVREKTGEGGFTSQPRKFKAPGIIAICSAILMLISAAVAAAQVFAYTKEGTFFLDNLTYEFVDGDYYEGAPVYITGYVGLGGEEILIPNEIEGHPIVGIDEYSFANNSTVKKVVIEEGVTVSSYAFEDCYNLESVEFLGENTIEKHAFLNCSSLSSIVAHDLKQIEKEAFKNVYALKTLRITSSNNEESLVIESGAFTNCGNLSSVYIDEYVSYRTNAPIFKGVDAIDSLYLKNYNYSQHEGSTTKELYDLFDESNVQIKNLEIKYTDKIPNNFVSDNSALNSVKISVLTNSTIGDSAFEDCTALTDISLPKKITQIGAFALSKTAIKEFDVSILERMGKGAFSECASLQTLDFGMSTLTSLPQSAFEECTALTEISLPNGLTSIGENAFYECTSLCEIEIPNGVETIDEFAFGNATNLRYISLPATLSFISFNAFENCYHLHEIENLSSINIQAGEEDLLGEYTLKVYTSTTEARIEKYEIEEMIFGNVDGHWYALEYVGTQTTYNFPETVNGANYVLTDYLFYNVEGCNTVNIKSGAYSLGECVFASSSIKEVIFKGTTALAWTPETFSGGEGNIEKINFGSRQFTKIYESSFYDFDNLKEVQLSRNVTVIEENAFADCRNLQRVTGASSVVEIQANAFNNCQALTQLSFGSNLLTIGDYAFAKCKKLENVSLPANLVSIGVGSFQDCDQIGTLSIPSNTISIGEYAFESCDALRSVTGGSLQSIGYYAFANCPKLENFAFASTITSIGYCAFSNCSALKTVDLPSLLTVIQSGTFEKCSALETVVFPSSLAVIEYEAFKNCSALKTVDLPSSLTVIESDAFEYCTELEKVYLSTRQLSIGTDAFNNCKKLHEVYNLGGLSLSLNSTDNGYLTYNAVAIHTSRYVSLMKRTTSAGIVYKYSNNVCAIVDYTGSAKSLYLDSTDYSSYIIARYAFEDCNSLTNLTIGTAVTDIRTRAFSGMYALKSIKFDDGCSLEINNYTFQGSDSLNELIIPTTLSGIKTYAFGGVSRPIIYYRGTEKNWYSYGAARYSFNYLNVYYYDACAHENNQWKYNSNGKVDISNKELSIEQIVVPATCTTEGTKKYSCPDCSKTLTTKIDAHGHQFEDNVCIHCGYSNSDADSSSSLNGSARVIKSSLLVTQTTNPIQPIKIKKELYQE